MQTIALVLIFACITLCVFLILNRLRNQQSRKTDEFNIRRPNTFGFLTEPLAGVIPHTESKKTTLKNELLGAGQFHSNALINYLAKRNLGVMAVILASVVCYFGEYAGAGQGRFVLIAGVVATILAYGLPRLVLSSFASKRRHEIEHAFPDALDMVAMSVEGGLPLKDALSRVSEEFHDTHPSLAKELMIISRQTNTGSVQQAMSSFAERVDLPEMVAWSALMSQSQRLGGKLASSFLDCADRMRHNRKIQAEQAGNTASIKLLLPTVLCLAPPIFIILIGPAVIDFREFINREREETIKIVESATTFPEELRRLGAGRNALPRN